MTPVPLDEPSKKRSASDFIFGKVIGEGSFSTVYLAKDIHVNKEFAIKVLDKVHIQREKKIEYVLREKEALLKLSGCNSLFVKLYCTFQDNERLYFVLTYAKNGDLLSHLNSNFSFESALYYGAELVLALEILNGKGIIHRDLKPENILLDENRHILLTDFGSSKIVTNVVNNDDIEETNRRRNSFVGTAQYVTPEVLTDRNVSYASDLWALGCVIYQMVCHSAPFKAGSDYLIFKKILNLEYEFPENFNPSAKDLVKKLLVLAPTKRLGALDDKPYVSLREHEFFQGINWDNLGPPPSIHLETEENEDVEPIPEELEPGFDGQIASKLHLQSFCPCPIPPPKKFDLTKNIADLDETEIERRLALQKNDCWHNLVEGNLIIKQGLIDKRKGFFPKRRMLLLTMGPHLYYVDPATMILKGEIPWSVHLRPEAKNFKTFFVHTPNRTYYLEDPEGYALEWCKTIEDVKAFYYSQNSC